MSNTAFESLLNQIATLPATQKMQLRQFLDEQLARDGAELTGAKLVEPIPEPDQEGALRWLSEHGREYAGQWVALAGDRLIVHGSDHKQVFSVAEADGAYLPLITFIEPFPDNPFIRL